MAKRKTVWDKADAFAVANLPKNPQALVPMREYLRMAYIRGYHAAQRNRRAPQHSGND